MLTGEGPDILKIAGQWNPIVHMIYIKITIKSPLNNQWDLLEWWFRSLPY